MTDSTINQPLKNLIDRYLYPDQIIFGHLFNPNIKSSHAYQMSKSNPQLKQNDEIIIYQKHMSQTKIKSMLSMMEGNHQPLFKSSLLPKSTHVEKYYNESGEESFVQNQDDYEDYDEEMYLMENQYENQFEDEYDDEQNPIMAFGQSLGAFPAMKNYAKEFNYSLQNLNHHPKATQNKLSKSQQQTGYIEKQGLGKIVNSKNQKKLNYPPSKEQSKPKKVQENESDEQWETESQQQVEN